MGWTPLDLWSDMWTNSLRLAQAGWKTGEMMQASADVIGSRCQSMAEASRNPVTGDYAELGRMVPEKLDAFSRAGWAALRNLETMNAAAIANMAQASRIAAAGRFPTAAEMQRLSSRSSRMVACASAAAGKTLAPVHKRATGNARRLKRKKK
jgi:hypothetical protein